MLSVIIISKNEELNLKRCLESVRFADEIIVVDSGSTDNTVAIAKQYTPHVFSTDWPGYGVQKQRALSKAQGDWILNLDADESLTPELQLEIQAIISSDHSKAEAYRVPIRMNFYGQLLKYSGSPCRHIRLFKRANAQYSEHIVHEKIILPPETRVAQLQYAIEHHCYQDISHAVYKMNKYSSYSAKIKINSHKQASFVKTIMGTGWMFFRCYVLQRGLLDGKAGFLLAAYNAQGTFYRGMKQLYQDSNLDTLPGRDTCDKD